MLLKNAKILGADWNFNNCDLRVENGRITEIGGDAGIIGAALLCVPEIKE